MAPLDVNTLVRRSIGGNAELEAGLEVLLPLFATVVVVVRLWLRRKYKISLKVDDALIVLSLPFTWGLYSVWTYISLNLVNTRHNANSPKTQNGFQTLCLTMDALYGLGINVVKFAILFFYRRAFLTPGATNEGQTRFWLYLLFVVCGMYTVARIMETVFLCVPICMATLQDNFSVPGFYLAMRAINWLTEIAILSFPIPILWRMQQLSTKKKIGISLTFLLGLLTCVSSAMRLYLAARQVYGITDMGPLWFYNYYVPIMSRMTLCSLAELNTGILCATIPAIRSPVVALAKSAMCRLHHRANSGSGCGSTSEHSSAVTPHSSRTKSFDKAVEVENVELDFK